MKNLILISLTIGLSVSVATTASAGGHNGKKKSYDEAKKECLMKDSSLKGKKLQDCIKKKRK
jgi:hypothetical protein